MRIGERGSTYGAGFCGNGGYMGGDGRENDEEVEELHVASLGCNEMELAGGLGACRRRLMGGCPGEDVAFRAGCRQPFILLDGRILFFYHSVESGPVCVRDEAIQ